MSHSPRHSIRGEVCREQCDSEGVYSPVHRGAICPSTRTRRVILRVTQDNKPAFGFFASWPPCPGAPPAPATMPSNAPLSLGASLPDPILLQSPPSASATRAFPHTAFAAALDAPQCSSIKRERSRAAIRARLAWTHAEAPPSFRTPARVSMAATWLANLVDRDDMRSALRAADAGGGWAAQRLAICVKFAGGGASANGSK